VPIEVTLSLVVMLFLTVASSLFSQSITGDIRGTVRDSSGSGAVVPELR
jgi:hypothetical protein